MRRTTAKRELFRAGFARYRIRGKYAMQKSKLSAADLERIAEVLNATEREWRASQPSRTALRYHEDTGWFTAEELRPPAAPVNPRAR
jgi:hypothetical protein